MNINEKLFNKSVDKIRNVLEQAYNSKYYKKLFDEVGIDINNKFSYEEFCKINPINKEIYNKYKHEMATYDIGDFDRNKYEQLEVGSQKAEYLKKYNINLKITSGSTGQPLEVFRACNDEKKDYITLNYYRRKLTKYKFKGRFIWIWPINPIIEKYYEYNEDSSCNPEKINNYGDMYSLYELSEKNFCDLYTCIINNNYEWITTSPTVLYHFSQYIYKNNLKAPKFEYIECHSERLYEWQSKMIYDVFGIIPISIYSSNEIQFMGAKCNMESIHLFTNSTFVEFVNNTQGVNELYVTSLNYTGIPIIRYKLGDSGNWCENQNCKCGLIDSPIFKLNGFRTNDFLITKSNTLIEPFMITDSIYYFSKKFSLEIKEHKIRQLKFDLFEYYFEEEIAKDINGKYQFFLEAILSEALGYRVFVKLKDIKEDKSVYYGKKYKRFEVDIK